MIYSFHACHLMILQLLVDITIESNMASFINDVMSFDFFEFWKIHASAEYILYFKTFWTFCKQSFFPSCTFAIDAYMLCIDLQTMTCSYLSLISANTT